MVQIFRIKYQHTCIETHITISRPEQYTGYKSITQDIMKRGKKSPEDRTSNGERSGALIESSKATRFCHAFYGNCY